MKPNSMLAAIVIDRSGSMSSVVDDTIGGFNTLLREQQQLHGDVRMTLVQFDDHYDVLHSATPVRHVAPLNHATYVPRGWTALLDAIGRTIDDVGASLAAMPEHERPARVILVVLTDGAENASRVFTGQRVREMIQHQRERYSWEFVVLGSSLETITAAHNWGIGITRQYVATNVGTDVAFKGMSAGLGEYFTCGVFNDGGQDAYVVPEESKTSSAPRL